MPRIQYEYHLKTYIKVGDLEPPDGGNWRIYKSQLSKGTLYIQVIWRRPIPGSMTEPGKFEPIRSMNVACINEKQCQGPYGPDKCTACGNYYRSYPNGKASIPEMVDVCEKFLCTAIGKTGGDHPGIIRDLRLQIDLHGTPSVKPEQLTELETFFHSLFKP
jgi:hypothetical protein